MACEPALIFIGSLRYFFLRWHQVGGRYPNRQLSEQALRAACGGPASGAVSVPVSDRDAPLAGQLFAGAPRSTRGPRPGGPARARVPFFRARGRPNPSSPSNAAQARTRGKLRLPRTPTGAARSLSHASPVERSLFARRGDPVMRQYITPSRSTVGRIRSAQTGDPRTAPSLQLLCRRSSARTAPLPAVRG